MNIFQLTALVMQIRAGLRGRLLDSKKTVSSKKSSSMGQLRVGLQFDAGVEMALWVAGKQTIAFRR